MTRVQKWHLQFPRSLSLLFAFLFLLPLSSLMATPLKSPHHLAYYGEDFYASLSDKSGAGLRDLASELNSILNEYHLRKAGEYDDIITYCEQKSEEGCYTHRTLSYKEARKVLFQQLHLELGPKGPYVRDIYCQKIVTNQDFPNGRGFGPDIIPDANVINVEHTWPQKNFNTNGRYSKNMQKTDLHHLYPSLSRINGLRGHYPFGEVTIRASRQYCDNAILGKIDGVTNEFYFLPPAAHRGNVARALFYFAVKYEMPISPIEEKSLRKWHREDPVDAQEKLRNERIYAVQGSRNPFIDFPELADKIADF